MEEREPAKVTLADRRAFETEQRPLTERAPCLVVSRESPKLGEEADGRTASVGAEEGLHLVHLDLQPGTARGRVCRLSVYCRFGSQAPAVAEAPEGGARCGLWWFARPFRFDRQK